MTKKLFLTLLCLVSLVGAQAQTEEQEKDEEKMISVELRGGPALALLVTKTGSTRTTEGRRATFHAGLAVNVSIGETMRFETGLYFVQKGYKEKVTIPSVGNVESKGNPGYLEIPLMVSYHHSLGSKIGVEMSTGPYLAYGVCGKAYTKKWNTLGIVTADAETDWFGGKDDFGTARFRRFDVGWHIGGGLRICSRYYVGYAFEVGFKDMERTSAEQYKTRCHLFNLGFRF